MEIWRHINWYIQERNLSSVMNVTLSLQRLQLSKHINWYTQGRNLISVIYVTIALGSLGIWKNTNWIIQKRNRTSELYLNFTQNIPVFSRNINCNCWTLEEKPHKQNLTEKLSDLSYSPIKIVRSDRIWCISFFGLKKLVECPIYMFYLLCVRIAWYRCRWGFFIIAMYSWDWLTQTLLTQISG